MSREGGREKRWHDAHNYVHCTVASVTPLRASKMGMMGALSRCRRRSQDKASNRGPSSSHCHQGRAMAYRPRHVVVVSSQGGRARVHQHRCQGEGDGDGEGASSSSKRGSGRGSACRERVSTLLSLLREREGERVSTLLLLLLERGRGCIVIRERVSSSERR